MAEKHSNRPILNTDELDDDELSFLATAEPIIERARDALPELQDQDVYVLVRSALAWIIGYRTTHDDVSLIRSMNSLGLALAGLEAIRQRQGESHG